MPEDTAPVAELESQTPPVIADESPPPVDDAAVTASVSLPADGVVESTPTSLEPAPPAPPEAATVRTLADVWQDVQANKPVLPAEYDALVRYNNDQQVTQRAETERQQRITQAFPDTAKGVLDDVTDLLGVVAGSPEHIALQHLVEARILHGDESLQSVASAATVGPIYDAQAGWLFSKMGASREAGDYIRRLNSTQMLETAHELGARSAARAQVETLDDAKIEQLAKGELKAAGKTLPYEGVQKAIERAVSILRDAHPERFPPVPGQAGSASTQTLTWAQVQRMDGDQLARLSTADYEAATKRV